MLLCAGAALSLLCVGQINLSSPNGPDLYLQKTKFGWVFGGTVSTCHQRESSPSCFSTTTLQNDLSRFWEIEEGPQKQYLSKSEAICEEHFQKTTTRNKHGRYVVALPFNESKNQLGESRARAEKRLLALERRLMKEPDLKAQYTTVINEYLELGHMSRTNPRTHGHSYYLPHHGVIKARSNTTKLRVVFDGSAETTSGISLNDTLHTGPKIQDDLLYILLRFRTHQYVITGDIEKMYRQFLVRLPDRRYQRILWRDHSGKIQTYELNTVTFGLSAAPYLAIRCLKQLALDEGHRYPHAANILQRDFYVDDALTGATTKQEAFTLRQELTQLLSLAGLNVRQWASNDSHLLRGLPASKINNKLHLGESTTVKTLGVYWDSAADTINYSITITTSMSQITKRVISSEIAKIYDPLGLLGPVIIVAKILLQKIWALKIDWDELLPMDIHHAWSQYYYKLPLLNNISFSRKTVIRATATIQLHGFCDASERAYGACVYLRTIDSSGNIQTELLVAKSKVAPLKSQTIPRLELCGALLLSSLLTTVRNALHLQIDHCSLWTDSTIVLHWINTSPHTLKTFVANRVAEIQEKTRASDWHHIRTEDNPADLISRGQSPEDFLKPSNWHNGPKWLRRPEADWPTWKVPSIEGTADEQKGYYLSGNCHN
ncbi:PREDICTED: uncharacterized protein LOC108575302 [Habropoda laboriosa]|uniref:uncharacterized protein LOC108575302 n=1 Tax=Habropoda laboriosa TaxID=597456 RepID=UPI00083DE43B|nr:PREDICTED: uncharacterized protein LOC108575302 [Habropoda laboriosa]